MRKSFYNASFDLHSSAATPIVPASQSASVGLFLFLSLCFLEVPQAPQLPLNWSSTTGSIMSRAAGGGGGSQSPRLAPAEATG